MLFICGGLFLIVGFGLRSWRLMRRAVIVLYLATVVASISTAGVDWLAWFFGAAYLYQIGICGLAVFHLVLESRAKSTRGRQLLFRVARFRNHHDVWFTDLI